MWHSPRSLSKIFFLVIRYGFLLDTTLVLFYTLRITSDSGPTLTASRYVAQSFYSVTQMLNQDPSCKALYDAATIIQVSSFVAVSGKYLRQVFVWSFLQRYFSLCRPPYIRSVVAQLASGSLPIRNRFIYAVHHDTGKSSLLDIHFPLPDATRIDTGLRTRYGSCTVAHVALRPDCH